MLTNIDRLAMVDEAIAELITRGQFDLTDYDRLHQRRIILLARLDDELEAVQ